MRKKRTIFILLTLLVVLSGCGKIFNNTGTNEYTIDGKTYKIGATCWSKRTSHIGWYYSSSGKEHFSLQFNSGTNNLEEGDEYYIGDDDSFLSVGGPQSIVASKGTYLSWNDVTVKINYVDPKGEDDKYGIVKGTFEGYFVKYDDLMDIIGSGGNGDDLDEYYISGKFETSIPDKNN